MWTYITDSQYSVPARAAALPEPLPQTLCRKPGGLWAGSGDWGQEVLLQAHQVSGWSPQVHFTQGPHKVSLKFVPLACAWLEQPIIICVNIRRHCQYRKYISFFILSRKYTQNLNINIQHCLYKMTLYCKPWWKHSKVTVSPNGNICFRTVVYAYDYVEACTLHFLDMKWQVNTPIILSLISLFLFYNKSCFLCQSISFSNMICSFWMSSRYQTSTLHLLKVKQLVAIVSKLRLLLSHLKFLGQD